MALIMLMPPACSAGKNFTTSRPREMAISTSLGLEVPGVTGIPLSTQYFTTVGLETGAYDEFCSGVHCAVHLLGGEDCACAH